MRIAALGRTGILLETIKILNENGHDIVLIGTCREAPEYKVDTHDFEQLAADLGAVFFNETGINKPSIVHLLYEVQADIALSINWLTIIGKEAINAFPLGVLNGHAGDLPRYRGNACPNWAILEGEEEIAVTVHLMDPDKLDGGPIVMKSYMRIDNGTTIGQVYAHIQQILPEMFLQAIEGLGKGNIVPEPQPADPYQALRTYPRIPSDSLINWGLPASKLERLVRASSRPFSGAYTYYNGRKLTILQARATSFPCPSLAMPGQVLWRSSETGEVAISTGDGVLLIREVYMEEQKSVCAEAVLTSNRIRLGTVVEDELYELRKRIESLEAMLGESKNGL